MHSLIEKKLHRRFFSLSPPSEQIFYEKMRPLWPFIAARSPELISIRHSLRSVTLALSDTKAKAPARAKLPNIIERFDFIDTMHRNGPPCGMWEKQVPHYFSLPKKLRFRGRYTLYLKALPHFSPDMKKDLRVICRNLKALDRACRRHRHYPAHLDITAKNILPHDTGFHIIDWGEFCAAPAGFEYGSVLFSTLKRNRKYLNPAIRHFHDMDLPEETYISAYFFLIVSCLHALHVAKKKRTYQPHITQAIAQWIEPLKTLPPRISRYALTQLPEEN